MSKSTLITSSIPNCLKGALVADAASMGTHWIYDPKEMANTVTSLEKPEFRTPPSPKYYSATDFPNHYGAGMPSPYGEQLQFVTNYVSNIDDVQGETMSTAMVDWANTFGGRPDSATKKLLENINHKKGYPNCGADDSEAHCFMKAIPVTCRYAGSPQLKDKVEQAIRVHQNNDVAVAFGVASSQLLEKVLLGSSIAEALASLEGDLKGDVLKALQRAKSSFAAGQSLTDLFTELSHESVTDPTSAFYDLAARSCALPGSFIGPMHLLYASAGADSSSKDAYATAMRTNILASGDTCSRAQLIGAVLGAAYGVPTDWVDQMDQATTNEMDAAAARIVKLQQ